MEYRSWMYNRNYPNRRFLREEFIEGVKEFITHAMSLEPFRIEGLIRCPCVKCKCLHFFGSEDVKTHLYKKGFMDDYFVWISHGEDLQRYWTIKKFKKQSELGKKARASEKGGSLHCLGSRSIGDTKRHLEKKYGRKMSHDEFFMETHIRKKKASTDPTRWVEDQAETTHDRYKINVEEYTQILPPNEQGERPSISDEETQRIWLGVVDGPKKGIAYGLPDKSFRRYRAGFQGIGTSVQGEAIDRSTISSMEQKIAKLTAELQETKARDKKRDEQFGTLQVQLERRDKQFNLLQVQLEKRDEQFNLLQGQLANLLASGAFPIPRYRETSPCADDKGSRREDGDDAR